MAVKSKSPMAILLLALVVPFLVQGSLAQTCGSQAGGALCAGGLCCSEFGFCGTTTAYCATRCQSQCTSTPSTPSGSCGTSLGGVVSQSLYQSLFPNRNAIYSYENMITAASFFPSFATTGDCNTRKKEVAAFFAHISHETSGLVYTEEIDKAAYCDPDYPCAAGKQYFGRGPLQLTWNYNYKQCGDSSAVSLDLVNNPDQVAQNGVIAFKAAIWFWMTAQNPKPACHAVITGGWSPSSSDSADGRTATFGMTTVIINGGLECGSGASNPERNTERVSLFNSMSSAFGVSPGSGLSCASMKPYSA
ncbi:basic endochitinase B [Marchantia polymorpha subsp. ruderalis]|uniref:Chitin-binding type-1 domain-containing protein n=2 Tax=Marchantia polymorpha TaxID=3197 RepID=A0AAF6BBZ0_MARPO|nr:hypothetical protein MARPO_0116s0045 [Marchantia polymorpha]BBN09524.1 hypothetical protein Mp_4g20440 [Marchantia polymorpha subsp. ruderalis]|eukprot:PTQ31059.1 hypothetical protein MARPO_0116s0045 [Marchantia polymorpha]